MEWDPYECYGVCAPVLDSPMGGRLDYRFIPGEKTGALIGNPGCLIVIVNTQLQYNLNTVQTRQNHSIMVLVHLL